MSAPRRTSRPAPAGDGAGAAGGEVVDLNRATIGQLCALPGIGPATARRIVAARQERTFATIDAVVERRILTRATFDKLQGRVTVR